VSTLTIPASGTI